jgi:glutamyl-tRNA synthetase
MGITHVLRGEDLLSSTPRQVVLYRALLAIGVASVEPAYGHLPLVRGDGNQKLSKRAPESDLFLHRDRGFVPEGLLNYLALLGWGIGADRDVFTVEEMVAAFDVHDVNPNPARFDLEKAEAVNAAHVRLLDPGDLAARTVPFLHAAGLVSGPTLEGLTDRERALVLGAAPLVQPRLTLLGEAPDRLGFLFVEDEALAVDPAALADLPARSGEVLDAALAALEALPDEEFTTAAVEAALRAAIVEGLAIKPRQAFGPVRVAVTGRRVSPPLFESMELLGRPSCLARLRALRARG